MRRFILYIPLVMLAVCSGCANDQARGQREQQKHEAATWNTNWLRETAVSTMENSFGSGDPNEPYRQYSR